MTYRLSNKCTKNYCNQTIYVEVIVKDVQRSNKFFSETQCESLPDNIAGMKAIVRLAGA